MVGVVGVAIIVSIVVVMIVGGERGPRTWIVPRGETLTLSPFDVHPDDLYRCPGKGGVDGTPKPGHGVSSGGEFSVSTAADGTVTARCEPGPPGNV